MLLLFLPVQIHIFLTYFGTISGYIFTCLACGTYRKILPVASISWFLVRIFNILLVIYSVNHILPSWFSEKLLWSKAAFLKKKGWGGIHHFLIPNVKGGRGRMGQQVTCVKFKKKKKKRKAFQFIFLQNSQNLRNFSSGLEI